MIDELLKKYEEYKGLVNKNYQRELGERELPVSFDNFMNWLVQQKIREELELED